MVILKTSATLKIPNNIKVKKNILELIIKIYKKYIYVFSIIIFSFYKIFNIKIFRSENPTNLQKIGFIDQDGLIHIPSEYYSYVNSGDLYIKGDFLHRKRFSITVILKENQVFLEKKFKNNFFSFYNELTILHELRNTDCVPKVYFVNYENLSFVMNYIEGYVLREKVAKCGVLVRDIDKKMNVHLKENANKFVSMDLYLKRIVNLKTLQNI